MYGPPGTGKSRLARHIARELGLELYVARLDGLISSFSRQPRRRISARFLILRRRRRASCSSTNSMRSQSLRGDTQELGELKRVVNSFIQNLDTLGSQSIVIAATNHQELLDSAIWRRFQLPAGIEFSGSGFAREDVGVVQRGPPFHGARNRATRRLVGGVFQDRILAKSACACSAAASQSNNNRTFRMRFGFSRTWASAKAKTAASYRSSGTRMNMQFPLCSVRETRSSTVMLPSLIYSAFPRRRLIGGRKE